MQTSEALKTSASSLSSWAIDAAHTTAQFSVRHMMISTVRGQFEKVSGTVQLDDQDLTRSKIEVTIDVDSITSREPKRDAHLKSPDFFDAEKFPALRFVSTRFEKKGSKLEVTGDLTIKDVTRPVTLVVDELTQPLKNPWGQLVRGVSATGKINRKDWGLNWNAALEAGGVLVGEDVTLHIDAELIAQ